MTTRGQHAVAVLAVINAPLPAAIRAYETDHIPDPLPDQYVEVILTRVFGGEPMLDGSIASSGWLIFTRFVAKSITNAGRLQDRVGGELEGRILTIAGRASTPVTFETEEPIAPDNGWYSGSAQWAYTIP